MSANQVSVIVIGGVGQMGRHVCRLLARFESVARVDVADIAQDKAALLASELGPKGNAVVLDATDVDALRDAFADIDFVVNALGPFNHFALPILTTAIEAGVDYIDVCDDWEATVDLLALDGRARERGVRAIIGLGMSPGLTNLLAKRAAEELDEVDRMVTGWPVAGTRVEHEDQYDVGRSATAAAEHLILQCSGKIRVFAGGDRAEVTPLQKVEIDYPGIGAKDARSLGHPEPITLPMTFRGIDESLNVMTGPTWVFDRLAEITRRYEAGEIDLREAASLASGMSRPADAPREPRDNMPTAWAQVTGTTNGERRVVSAHLSAWPPHFMGGATGYPAAVGVDLLARGASVAPGVVAPEQAFDPTEFFAALGDHVENGPVRDYVVVVSVPA
ncbi:saccharopine dehydrogenase family protein [Streptomyces sp. MMCC 100]